MNSTKPPKPITDAERVDAIKRKEMTGQRITKDDILTIRDAQTRQRLIAENLQLFTKKQ